MPHDASKCGTLPRPVDGSGHREFQNILIRSVTLLLLEFSEVGNAVPDQLSDTMDAPQLHTFVINLDRSPDRLRVMQERLARVGLKWDRIAAVEGSNIDLAQCPEVDATGYRRAHGKELNLAELGCYLSHVQALRRFMAGPWEFALVQEDDADFPSDFLPLLEQLLQAREHWDLVKLSSFHSGTPVRIVQLTDSYDLAVPLSRLMNANSILFNRRAAEVLLEKLLPMKLPYDHALECAYMMGLRLRMVTPSPCPSETGLSSTIGDRTRLRQFKLRWYRRAPAMLFRARTEVQRACHGIVHLLRAYVLERRKILRSKPSNPVRNLRMQGRSPARQRRSGR